MGIILLVMISNAVELSVCIGISGCGCPISMSIFLSGAANFALMYNMPDSASFVDDITALMTCTMLWIVPLLAGDVVLLDMKKCPPALLYACVSFKYEALL